MANYKQYNYFVTYRWNVSQEARYFDRTTPLTVHDNKGDMIAAEIMNEIQRRVEEMENASELNIKVEIISVNLLSQHNLQ